MNELYRCIGISKQAAHQYANRQVVFDDKVMRLVKEAEALRKAHPGCGVEKMYHVLTPGFIGRDRFVEAFMGLGFRVRRQKNYRRTTFAGRQHYPNLIKGMTINRAGLIWQSDITYIHVNGRFYYAVFIIDIYSKQIVGYQVSDHMRTTANVKALNMAFKWHKPPKIHHSDRGGQYLSSEYTKLLKDNGCAISMSQSAQDNAYAERINRTIKEEYLEHWKPKNFKELRLCLKRAVSNYNSVRPHWNLRLHTPDQHKSVKQTITIFDNN
ncbi:MAG: hypothetical protein Roseis3KO_47190 [Roseivirga sp.]